MQPEVLQRISQYLWEIPRDPAKGMLVPARIFASEDMLPDLMKDRSLDQLVNVTTLPGILMAAIVMPDVHEGYGFPIGGVAATEYPHGAISPGGIGYDINCGVRLLTTPFRWEEVQEKIGMLGQALFETIPSGTGKGGAIKLSTKAIDEVLRLGAAWAVKNGYGNLEDLEKIESNGKLEIADPRSVSLQAKKRGHDQLGTIGAGNHFVEVDRVMDIFDEKMAEGFQLFKDQIVVLIHTGSRGLGHQIATDYIKIMIEAMEREGFKSPDRELSYMPFDSREGQEYYKAMAAAANFAWCNREVITWEVREAWKKVFGVEKGNQIRLLYDVAHNIAKIETYNFQGKEKKVIVHRKGATRAFGPYAADLPTEYRPFGQPVLIPGSMGTASYVLVGTSKSQELSFGSSCHGAGRRMSRRGAKRVVNAPELKKELLEQGIIIEAGSYRGIAEEAPIAYKDVDRVVEVVHQADIAKKVAKLKPLTVIKG